MLGDGAQGFPFAFVQLAHRLFDGGSGDAHVFLRYWVPWTSTSPSRSPGPAHDRQDHTTVVMGLEVSPIPGSQTGWDPIKASKSPQPCPWPGELLRDLSHPGEILACAKLEGACASPAPSTRSWIAR